MNLNFVRRVNIRQLRPFNVYTPSRPARQAYITSTQAGTSPSHNATFANNNFTLFLGTNNETGQQKLLVPLMRF